MTTSEQDIYESRFLNARVPRRLLVLNWILALAYLFILAFVFPIGNMTLFVVLILTEIFHLFLAGGFWWTAWQMKRDIQLSKDQPAVDVAITVCGEPADIVRQTVLAAKAMNYPNFHIYILNDGYAAKKDNWQEIMQLAKSLGVNCITRKTPGGAKAGNINNALKKMYSPFVAVFDADHVPRPEFLKRVMQHFYSSEVAFIQTPQYYKNHDLNLVTQASWEQQTLFFGPVCRGKDCMNSAFLCGTNMVIRREALLEAGGMAEDSIAEDFLTSMRIHQNGWQSVYVPEILADGLAPEDLHAYCLQQFRWARGSLEVLFWHNPLFARGLSWRQKLQYLSSSGYWLNGIVVFLNAVFPFVFFFFGIAPFVASNLFLALIFLPYIFLTFYTLSVSTNFSLTAQAIAFSIGSFVLQIRATIATVFGYGQKFSVTPKRGAKQAFTSLAAIHLVYIAISIVGVVFSLWREGLNASVASNISWTAWNGIVFAYFVTASQPQENKIAELEPALN